MKKVRANLKRMVPFAPICIKNANKYPGDESSLWFFISIDIIKITVKLLKHILDGNSK